MAGNFLADTVRGDAHVEDRTGLRLGIDIHRFIDDFTDRHPVVLESRQLLYPYFSKYAAVVQDIFYDHFLAAEWHRYSDEPLKEFAARVYRVLGRFADHYNEKARRTYLYMSTHHWLESYATEAGIGRALIGMSHRARFPSNMENSLVALRAHRRGLDAHFHEFFPQLIDAVDEKFADRAALLSPMEP